MMVEEQFYNLVRHVIGAQDDDAFIALHEPYLDNSDASSVEQTVRSGWVSYQGEMVSHFETMLGSYVHMPFVVSVANGTSALFLALTACGIARGDEVLVPSVSFVATANAVSHTGATAHFIDCSEDDLTVDVAKLDDYLGAIAQLNGQGQLINKDTKRVIKAIIPVHIFGGSCDLDALQNLAQKYRIKIIEDSAEALGSKYKDSMVSGTTGLGVISFNGNKIITTGGGGAIVTDDASVYEKIQHISTTAKRPHAYEFDHDEIGFNLRLPALNAGLGCSQLEKIDMFLRRKKALYERYCQLFKEVDFGYMYSPNRHGESNHWLNAFVLDSRHKSYKNGMIEHMLQHRIGVRPLWKPLHMLQPYVNNPRAECLNSEDYYSRVICLPSSVCLANET